MPQGAASAELYARLRGAARPVEEYIYIYLFIYIGLEESNETEVTQAFFRLKHVLSLRFWYGVVMWRACVQTTMGGRVVAIIGFISDALSDSPIAMCFKINLFTFLLSRYCHPNCHQKCFFNTFTVRSLKWKLMAPFVWYLDFVILNLDRPSHPRGFQGV